MSQTRDAAQRPIGHDEWEQVLAQLRAEGFSPVESIKVTRVVLHVSLGEAKQIVHESGAWADERASFDSVHEVAESAATNL